MSSAALLNQDFGSESEDDNFNPAPADESDNDAAGDSEADVSSKPAKNGAEPRRSTVKDDDDEDGEDTKSAVRVEGREKQENGHRDSGDVEEDEEDGDESGGEDLNGADDDEDEEDEEDEEAVGRPRKRSRRDPRNQYLDVEAEVDEEDEGDEEDEEGQADPFIADTHPDDINDLPLGAETDDRRHRELDRQRERAQQMDAEKQAARLKELYGRSRTTAARDAGNVPKRMLLPDVEDASIWGVKCKPGKEREVIFAITKRMEERSAKDPLPIISAMERGGSMIGYIYVEARKQADVLASLDGISNVYPRTKILLVPISERVDLLRVTKTEQLQPGGYVRIKRGKYTGDLAQIDDVETNGLEVTLKIVPRLDYGLNEDANAPMVDGNMKGDAKRKRTKAYGLTNPATRPPQRLFSEVEAKKKHIKYLSSMSTFNKKHWTYLNDTYIDGYLVKEYKIQHLITKNVNPTLEEVTKFTAGAADGTENLDLAALAQSLKNTTANESYLPGDMVEVYEGEQTGVCGKAVSVRGDIVTLKVTDGDIQGQTIEVPVKGLRKRFKEGDHVKVIGGSRYRDEVGMVVAIKDDTVTILSDLSMQEITVFSKDLREATDSGVAGGLGRYDIHDLVQLDAATVGCVTKVDRESLRVLDQNGSIRSVLPSQISNKIEKRRNAVATDRNGNEIRTEDTVREVGGEQKQGVILHVYRSFLFLHNREQTENSGISVVRTNNVVTVAAKGGRVAQGASTGPDLSRMNPALKRNGANGNSAMPPPKSFGRDRALGQTVTIRRGPYKGLLGIVKDTTDTEARVELHTKGKTITVPKDTLGFKDALTGHNIDYARFAGGRGRGMADRGGFGGGTPGRVPDWQSSSRTPVPGGQGGRTPAWGAGARTPAWQAGSSRTPAWSANTASGARTPAPSYGAPGGATVNPYDGSRTAYGGTMAGGRTPAWNPTAGSNAYTNDPFSTSATGGGKTPAYDPSSSRTPAYQQQPPSQPQHQQQQQQQPDPYSSRPYDAPTPGKDVHAAPTPSGYANAPTPMAQQAPTPKFSGYAADAPTPFSGQPETPAAWEEGDGEDGGPRYEEGTPSP